MAKKLSTPFANDSRLRNDVPVVASTDQANKGVIGYTNGFTSINKLPLANGGQPPHMEDFNGVLYDVTSNIVDINKGLPQYYDDAYATLIGGYSIGSRLVLNDNSTTVISTTANNQNNPNTNMSGWVKLSDLETKDKISEIDNVSILSSIPSWDGRCVKTRSFYSGSAYGGSLYIYDSSKVSSSDGILNINGWILQFKDTINIYQLGFLGDAKTDETALLKSVVTAIKNYVTNSNVNKVILDGSSSYIMLSDNVTFDFCFIGLKNIRFQALDAFKPSSYTSLITYMTSDSWANVPITARKDFPIVHDHIEILGVDTRDNSIGLIIQPNSVVSMAGAFLKNLKIINFKYGFVLDENSYLINFVNPQIAGQYCCFTTSFSLGTNSGTQTNMGENIRFIGGTLANSKKVFEMLKGNGMGLHCYGVSFDYCGGTASTGFETWFDFQAGSSEFSFYGCHFESGNENAGLSKMFHLGYRSKISIFGGEMLFSSTTYNNCEHFCYNEDNGQISIEGTKIFAPSVKYWANKGLGKFTPMFNSPNNGETFLTSQYTKSLAFDPNMNDSGVSDIFVAGGYTDNVLESNQVKISKGTVSINNVTQNCIQVYKKNGTGSDDFFDIYIPRNSRSSCLSSCAIRMYLNNGNNSSNEVSYSLTLLKSRSLDSNGIPIVISSTAFSNASWNIDTASSDKELSITPLLTGDAYKGYNYYKLHCRLFNFVGQGTLCITGLGFEETD